MPPTQLRIVTRQSPLALWQANYVKTALEAAHPDLTITLQGITTSADRWLSTPLTEIGGKGLFVKELETALLEGHADIAIHSVKDMPAVLPDALELAAICERGDSRDVFISTHYTGVKEMPPGAVIGTSSLRRRSL